MEAKKIIGSETTYIGNERCHGGKGARVKITAIVRYDIGADHPDSIIFDDEHLASVGGVRPEDGVEIHNWIASENKIGRAHV